MTDQLLTWALVDQIAADLGATGETRRKWRQASRKVPAEWQIKIVDELKTRGLTVPFDAFAKLPDAQPRRVAA